MLLWTDESVEQRQIIVIVACWGMQITGQPDTHAHTHTHKAKYNLFFHVKSLKGKKMHDKAVKEF